MVEAARALALNSADRSQWQALAQHSKAVSDTIKSLVTNIRCALKDIIFFLYKTMHNNTARC